MVHILYTGLNWIEWDISWYSHIGLGLLDTLKHNFYQHCTLSSSEHYYEKYEVMTAIIASEEQTSGHVLSRWHSYNYSRFSFDREQTKTSPVTRLRKLSSHQHQQPIINLPERRTSRRESHHSLSSLPTSSQLHLSPRPDRYHLLHPLRKGSPQFHIQHHFSDLDIRNPKLCRQIEFADGLSNRRQNAPDNRRHGNGDQGNDDVVRSASSNSLPSNSLSVDSLIDQWTSQAVRLPSPAPLPPGSEHFEAVMGEMTTTPRREGHGGPDIAVKTVRISPLVQVTIGSPSLKPKINRNN